MRLKTGVRHVAHARGGAHRAAGAPEREARGHLRRGDAALLPEARVRARGTVHGEDVAMIDAR
eukprot:29107-Pelagococcus_subviridis.AAC.2